MIVFDCSRLYPFEYNGLQPHTSFLLIFSHILRVEGNTVVYLTVTVEHRAVEELTDGYFQTVAYFLDRNHAGVLALLIEHTVYR